MADSNKLELSPIPLELCGLNILQRHVISKCIPFSKILTLPKVQQRANKGAVVSVPLDVEQTICIQYWLYTAVLAALSKLNALRALRV